MCLWWLWDGISLSRPGWGFNHGLRGALAVCHNWTVSWLIADIRHCREVTGLHQQAKLVLVVIEDTVKGKDVYRRTEGRQRQVIAHVIEPCWNTSHPEVVADVTMIRLLMLPFCGFYCALYPSCHIQSLITGQRNSALAGWRQDLPFPGSGRISVSFTSMHLSHLHVCHFDFHLLHYWGHLDGENF